MASTSTAAITSNRTTTDANYTQSTTPETTTTVVVSSTPSSATTTTVQTSQTLPAFVIPLAVTMCALLLVTIIIVSVIVCRRRSTRNRKKPPMLPPPYNPVVNDTEMNQPKHPSRIELITDDGVEQNNSFNKRTSSIGSGYLEPTEWTQNELPQDNDQQEPDSIDAHEVETNVELDMEIDVDTNLEHGVDEMEGFYVDMEAGQGTLASGQKHNLPHHELIYSETDQIPKEISPPPCIGVNKKHDYVNAPNDPPATNPVDNYRYVNLDKENQEQNYANISHDDHNCENMQRKATLPKYSNIPLCKPDNIDRYTPKSKQTIADSNQNVMKSKQLVDEGASIDTTVNYANTNTFPRPTTVSGSTDHDVKGVTLPSKHGIEVVKTSVDHGVKVIKPNVGRGVRKVTPPQTLPKPSNRKQSVLTSSSSSSDSDSDEGRAYVNVPTKVCPPQYHGSKEQLCRVFTSSEHATK